MGDDRELASGVAPVDITVSASGRFTRTTRGLARAVACGVRYWLLVLAVVVVPPTALADPYTETVRLFNNAGESAQFFRNSYGYAIFPTIGKGGLGIGAAHGDGRVYSGKGHKYIGDTAMTQLSVGIQAGGEAYSEVIFFQNRDALKEFTSGNFEFGADVGAVVITSAASGEAATTGPTAAASGGKNDATTAGGYYKGLAVFMIVKGGAMLQVALAGQKFSYKPHPGSTP